MEECRAEAVALYLASNKDIAAIFGFTGKDAEDLVVYTFLGSSSLPFFSRSSSILTLRLPSYSHGSRWYPRSRVVRPCYEASWYVPFRSFSFPFSAQKSDRLSLPPSPFLLPSIPSVPGQAHMEARLGITQWLIDHKIASVELKHDADGKLVDAYARVDREKVLEKGQEVMGELLVNLQVLKSTGDGEGANGSSPPFSSSPCDRILIPPTPTAFYIKLTSPYDSWVSELRPLVFAKKLPRKIFVQPNTAVKSDGSGEVELLEYPVSVEGVIRSFVERGL